MTVTYTAEVATCRGFGCFLKLLFRWRGSIYKLVWPDLSFFLFIYYTLNLTYRLALDKEQKRVFESVVLYCEAYSDLIPLSFVLGFYISIIMQRWWDQYSSIPWPDPIAVFVSSHIHGQDERGRLMRRTIMRYVCVCLTMVFTMVSPRVKMRFPTLDHFVEAGLLLDNEKSIIQDLNEKFPRHSKHWLPIVWASSVVTRARREGRIRDDYASKTIIDELNKFRGQCGLLLNYDSISVPLVYTQVVTLAVYSYFVTSVMGRQWLEASQDGENIGGAKHRSRIDLYFPFFLTLQFFFYMGWLKVAESLINPFGEDDDDFEVNWIVDRNIQVSYLIVDEMHHEHPELIRDQYWDEVLPSELPYTVASEPFREEHPEASTAKIEVPAAGTGLSYNSTFKLDEMGIGDHAHMNDDAASGIHFMAKSSGSRPQSHYDRTNSMASNTSINTNMGLSSMGLNRVPSVTSVLKRLFSKEAPSSPQFPMSSLDGTASTPLVGPSNSTTGPGGSTFRHSISGSSLNLPKTAGGSIRITDQVIEEVDEQATITSMRRPDPHPSVRTIFANPANPAVLEDGLAGKSTDMPARGGFEFRPPPSAPVNVPYSSQQADEMRAASAGDSGTQPRFSDNFPEVLAASEKSGHGFTPSSAGLSQLGSRLSVAASGFSGIPGGPDGDNISVGSQTDLGDVDEPGDDEFTRLKRARQRQQRQKLLARSISAQQSAVDALALTIQRRQSDASIADTEVQFMDESGSSQVGLLSPSDTARNT